MAPKAKARTPPRIDPDILTNTFFEQLDSGTVCDATVSNLSLPRLLSPRGQPTRLYRCLLSNVTLPTPDARYLQLHDTRVEVSDLAALNASSSIFERVEIMAARLSGANFTESRFKSVLFKECKLDLSVFRMANLQQCVFDQCILTEADFYNADLSGTIFRRCDLSRADLSKANLTSVDIRDCRLDGLRGTPADMNGLIISPEQAPLLITLFGVIIGN